MVALVLLLQHIEHLSLKCMRKSWHQHWIEKARHNSEMCTCASGRKVGAIIVTPDNRTLSDGFNGVPVGYPHPTVCPRVEKGIPSGHCLDMCPCAHAESNAIDNAARSGVSVKGSYLYCTTKPCVFCMARIANSGITKVFYEVEYSHGLSEDIARHANIELINLNGIVSE